MAREVLTMEVGMPAKWLTVCLLGFFLLVGFLVWTDVQAKTAVKGACLKTHTVAECTALK